MNKPNKPEQNRLQEIADRYNVFIYCTEDKIVGVGLVRHDGYDCQRVQRAVNEAARIKEQP